MKRQDLVVALATLLCASAASAAGTAAAPAAGKTTDRTPASTKLPDSCTRKIQNIVLSAAGDGEVVNSNRKDIEIKHVSAKVGAPYAGGPDQGYNIEYKAHVDGLEFAGTVKMTMTRGGCLISHIDLDGSN